jgi:hypothetical protein
MPEKNNDKSKGSREEGRVQGRTPKDQRSGAPSQRPEDGPPQSADRTEAGQYTGEGTPSVQKK